MEKLTKAITATSYETTSQNNLEEFKREKSIQLVCFKLGKCKKGQQTIGSEQQLYQPA